MNTVEEFTAAFDAQVAKAEKFIVYFTGAMSECDMETGACTSWCPDCMEASPFIAKILDQATRPVLKGVVETKEEWVGVSTHPYKVHPLCKAGGVPCMILFEGNNELHRVEDLDGFKNDDLMAMFNDD